jgi:hypothetical protein
MKVVFELTNQPNQLPVEFNEVTNFNLLMYDELMLTTLSVPSFKITLFKGDGKVGSFGYWWNEFKMEIDNLKIFVYDSKDTLIANADVFEYDEKRDTNEVEFTARSFIHGWFDKQLDIKNNKTYGSTFSKGDLHSFVNIVHCWVKWFEDCWKLASDIECEFIEANVYHFFEPLAKVVYNKIMDPKGAFNTVYNLKIDWGFNGSRANFIKQLAQVMYAKFYYDTAKRKFKIVPFQQYDTEPIQVKNFLITNEKHDKSASLILDITLFKEIRYYVYRGGSWDIKKECLETINNKLKNDARYFSYDVWGYNENIMYSGQTIKFDDDIPYLIRDIIWETTTIDSIKSFNAVCIKYRPI